ncbi:MAG: tRNA (adenosine(37)-N6)-threonylcarbamoyltransferase complex transferase subunit TsaD [Patescibacteria group bacterium]
MIILAIETSCDETAGAIIAASGDLKHPRFKILSNIVSSQIKVHAPFGGVVPSLAKREHQRNLFPVLTQALKQSKLLKISKSQFPISKQISNKKFQILNVILEKEPELLEQFKKRVLPLKPPKIDAIAVTAGPGLEPALWVGVNFARALSFLWKKPLIAVNHVEGHIIANWLAPIRENLKSKIQNPKIIFPALCLIASGGHTQLVLMRDFGKYKVIGETRDDAAGEAFDKAAKMLKLGFPGGPAIAAEAAKILNPKFQILNKFKIILPRPMMNSKDYDFSFSGLKTALLYKIKELQKIKTISYKLKAYLCAEFQQAAIDVLIAKTIKAAKKLKVKTVLLGGGVAANKKLRQELENAVKKNLPGAAYFQPSLEFTGDNAAMIAAAACLHLKEKKDWRKLKAKADWKI